MNVAVFSTKSYDQHHLERANRDHGHELTFFEPRLIAQTASQLRTQGAEIHKQASSTQLDMETLKKAFVDINAALDDISEFRKKALPQMADSILEMDTLTKANEEAIQRMEKGTGVEPVVSLDVA